MNVWENVAVFYTDLNRLSDEVAVALVAHEAPSLRHCFWERGFAGGPHLQIRFCGEPAAVEAAASAVEAALEQYVHRCPSTPLQTYSVERTERLLRQEGYNPKHYDLSYKVNVVLRQPYERLNHSLASDESARLIEAFLHGAMPFVAHAQRTGQKNRCAILAMLAATVCDERSPSDGYIMLRGHWESFLASTGSADLKRRWEAHYEKHKASYLRTYCMALRSEPCLTKQDDFFNNFRTFIQSMSTEVASLLKRGAILTYNMRDEQHVRSIGEYNLKRMTHDRSFVERLYDDPRFMMCFEYDEELQQRRITINLIYLLCQALGLSTMERMLLCFCLSQTVEVTENVSGQDALERLISTAIDRNFPSLQTGGAK